MDQATLRGREIWASEVTNQHECYFCKVCKQRVFFKPRTPHRSAHFAHNPPKKSCVRYLGTKESLQGNPCNIWVCDCGQRLSSVDFVRHMSTCSQIANLTTCQKCSIALNFSSKFVRHVFFDGSVRCETCYNITTGSEPETKRVTQWLVHMKDMENCATCNCFPKDFRRLLWRASRLVRPLLYRRSLTNA